MDSDSTGSEPIVDSELIARYDRAGPRYTSYPTAVQFDERFTAADYASLARESNRLGGPLSLYVHIPFCATVCYYCACNKIITNNRKRAAPYLSRLHAEIALQGDLFDRDRPVNQLHFGGGTPTFISEQEMQSLFDELRRHFHLHDDDAGEYSIEIDPREVTAASVRQLRELGFNRLSMGVQDFDPAVQRAVNRIQPREVTETAFTAARDAGFRSISIDLIYGLPCQSVASFDRTLDQVLELEPDRLSVFNYAHLPAMFKTQRQIDADELPSAEVRLAILQGVIARLVDAGYVYIGMDHFAKPDDELAAAQKTGTLYRNFQGYSTHADCDLVALGLTSIGQVGDSYSQNLKSMDDYCAAIDAGGLAVYRGVRLDADDRLRRAVITGLICHFTLDKASIESVYGVEFDRYFAAELEALRTFEDDGLVRLSRERIDVNATGRLLIRNICMVFDRYVGEDAGQRYSRAI